MISWFVFVVYVVLDVDCDDWCFVIGMYDYVQVVGQGELFVWDIDFGWCRGFGGKCGGRSKCVQGGVEGDGQ